jgi:hypothetical protein
MATKYGRSNGSFQKRVLACSAGGPGFDSRLRHNILRCSIQKDVDDSGQASTRGSVDQWSQIRITSMRSRNRIQIRIRFRVKRRIRTRMKVMRFRTPPPWLYRLNLAFACSIEVERYRLGNTENRYSTVASMGYLSDTDPDFLKICIRNRHILRNALKGHGIRYA